MARNAPVVMSARLTEAEAVRVEWAAQVAGLSRSAYIARAVAERARRDLARDRADRDDGEHGSDR